MRVTFNMLNQTVLGNLMLNSQRLMDAQDMTSSGKRIRRSSDDVPGMGRAISLRSTIASIEQFSRNSDFAAAQLSAASSAMQAIVSKMQDVRDKAMTAASSATSPEARMAIATQLDQIMRELADLGNTQHLGKYIFGGSITSSKPIIENAGDPPYIYVGDNRNLMVQVSPGIDLKVTITADIIFNVGGTAVPGTDDVFSVIKTLKELVIADDVEGISAHLDKIDDVRRNAISVNSQVGAQLKWLETAKTSLLDSKLRVEELLSKTEDIDLAEAIVHLRTQENLYQAALATANRVLNISLADYLK
jgi:flagellar hook-associated protein 3 FlgL